MQSANHLLRALKSGQPAFGGWQMYPGANLSRTLARTPGLTWLCIDLEHGNLSDNEMHDSVAAIAACQTVSPIVRVPEGQHWMIKRALDAGAHGIIVPLIRSVGDAKAVVAAAKFPPVGTRGLGSPFAMEKFVVGMGKEGREVGIGEYYREAGKATAIYAITGKDAKKWADQGFEMVNAALDYAVIRAGFGMALAQAHGKA